MATSTFRNKNEVRPRKTGVEKRRRCLVQRRRLVALGMSQEVVDKLPVDKLRALLKEPKKVVAMVAKEAAKGVQA
ncbi:MAG: hypothetical protein ACI4Q0_04410 [Oligosphaeraceae bacterium]